MNANQVKEAIVEHAAKGGWISKGFIRGISPKLLKLCERKATSLGTHSYTFLHIPGKSSQKVRDNYSSRTKTFSPSSKSFTSTYIPLVTDHTGWSSVTITDPPSYSNLTFRLVDSRVVPKSTG